MRIYGLHLFESQLKKKYEEHEMISPNETVLITRNI